MCRKDIFKLNEYQNHQKVIRCTLALKDLITETSNLSPAISLTFCISSSREILFSCKTERIPNIDFFQLKKKPATVSNSQKQVRRHLPDNLYENWKGKQYQAEAKSWKAPKLEPGMASKGKSVS